MTRAIPAGATVRVRLASGDCYVRTLTATGSAARWVLVLMPGGVRGKVLRESVAEVA